MQRSQNGMYNKITSFKKTNQEWFQALSFLELFIEPKMFEEQTNTQTNILKRVSIRFSSNNHLAWAIYTKMWGECWEVCSGWTDDKLSQIMK